MLIESFDHRRIAGSRKMCRILRRTYGDDDNDGGAPGSAKITRLQLRRRESNPQMTRLTGERFTI
jgi:hypothetical protein